MINNTKQIQQIVYDFIGDHPETVQIVIDLLDKYPQLQPIVPNILRSYIKLIKCFEAGNTLFICGNGGSFADSMHISAEMLKSFNLNRKLTESDKQQFNHLPYGKEIASALEYGFPTVVLGLNHSLFTALENDNKTRYIGFAQELFVLGKKDDVLLGISTSGNAKNVLYAISTAKAKGLITIGLTGENGGELAHMVDVAIKAPQATANKIQEYHLPVYHTLCSLVEAYYFQNSNDKK